MEFIKIGNVIDLVSGRDLNKGQYNDSTKGIPYIMGASNMDRGVLQIERWTEEPTVLGLKGDIVMSVKGTVGELLILEEEKVHLSRQVMSIRVNGEIDKEYMFFYLRYYVEKLKEKAKGMIPGITREDILQADFAYMDLPEQKKVVECLTRAEGLVNKRKKQIDACDELIKSQFIEMFGSIKDNKFGYEIVRLGDYAKLQGGYAFKSKDFVEDGTKLVQISNVNKDTLDWETVNCLPEEYLDKYSGFALKVGDIVLAMTRPVIKSLDAVKIAYVGEKDIPSLLNQRVGRFVISNEYINSAYLMECCRTRDFREYVERMSGNSLQPNVSSKQVEDYYILLPPLELQNQFATFVQQVDKLKFEMEQSLVELENNFNSLMQRAFKGELF